MDYSSYLKSKHWQKLQHQYLILGSKCKLCGRTNKLLLHHRTYNNLWKETEVDFAILCYSCHKKLHIKSNGNKRRFEQIGKIYQKAYIKNRLKIKNKYRHRKKYVFSCEKRYHSQF